MDRMVQFVSCKDGGTAFSVLYKWWSRIKSWTETLIETVTGRSRSDGRAVRKDSDNSIPIIETLMWFYLKLIGDKFAKAMV